MNRKRCPRCKRTKNADQFHRNSGHSDGLGTYCKPCQRDYIAEHYTKDPAYYKRKARARERSFRDRTDALKDVPCADCGVRWPAVGMDFDHLHGKLFDVCAMVKSGASWGRIQAEIDKCEVVCAGCHRVRTAVRRGKLPQSAMKRPKRKK